MIRRILRICKRDLPKLLLVIVALVFIHQTVLLLNNEPQVSAKYSNTGQKPIAPKHYDVIEEKESVLNHSQEASRKIEQATKKEVTILERLVRSPGLHDRVVNASEVLPQASLSEYPWQLMKYPAPTYVNATKSPCFFIGSKGNKDLVCMPHVFLAGFAKAGSSDLYSKICRHPHVVGGGQKEAQFWQHTTPRKHIPARYPLTFGNFLKNYRSYTTTIQNQCLGKHKGVVDKTRTSSTCPYITVDGSADYIFEAWFWELDELNPNPREPSFLAPHRIKHYIPHPKIIVIMRNPVDRLFSDFKFFAGGKNGNTYFHTLVVNGIAWWKNCTATLSEYRCVFGRNYTGMGVPQLNPEGLCDWGDREEWGHNGANRLRVSIYVLFVQKWLEVFSHKHFLFITSEEYKKVPWAVLTERIYPFLELDPLDAKGEANLKSSLKSSVNVGKRSEFHMLPETRQILEEFYRPYNERLANLLQEDKFNWK